MKPRKSGPIHPGSTLSGLAGTAERYRGIDTGGRISPQVKMPRELSCLGCGDPAPAQRAALGDAYTCRPCRKLEGTVVETRVPGIDASLHHGNPLGAEYEFWRYNREVVGRLILLQDGPVLCVRLFTRVSDIDWDVALRNTLAAVAHRWPHEVLDLAVMESRFRPEDPA